MTNARNWMYSPSYRTATLENWRNGPHNKWSFFHAREILPSSSIESGKCLSGFGARPLPLEKISFRHQGQDCSVGQVIQDSDTDAFIVIQDGDTLFETYAVGETPSTPHILFSVSKSVTAMLAGILAAKELLDFEKDVGFYVPELSHSGFGSATVQQVLDMTVTIAFEEEYDDPEGDVKRYRVASGWDPAVNGYSIGIRGFLTSLGTDGGVHGQVFRYASVCTDVLGWVLERVGGAPLATLLSEHLWKPMGAEHDAYALIDAFGVARAAGGICATLRDTARLGALMIQPEIAEVPLQSFKMDTFETRNRQAWRQGNLAYFITEGAYRNQWYLDCKRPDVAMAVGIYGQWIYLDRGKGLTIVKFSSQKRAAQVETDALLISCFEAIADSLPRHKI